MGVILYHRFGESGTVQRWTRSWRRVVPGSPAFKPTSSSSGAGSSALHLSDFNASETFRASEWQVPMIVGSVESMQLALDCACRSCSTLNIFHSRGGCAARARGGQETRT